MTSYLGNLNLGDKIAQLTAILCTSFGHVIGLFVNNSMCISFIFLQNVWKVLAIDSEEVNPGLAYVVVTNYICSATLIRTVFKHATTTHELK